jgi:hypothetical protein
MVMAQSDATADSDPERPSRLGSVLLVGGSGKPASLPA